MTPPLGPTLAFISAIPLVLLGLLLLSLRRRRSEQVFFGLFTALWGVAIAAANVGLVFDDIAFLRTGLLVTHAATAPAALFLAQFGASVHRGRWATLVPVATGAVALLATATLISRPRLVLEGVTAEAGGVGVVTLGGASFPLFFTPFFSVFYLVLALLYHKYRQAEPGSRRHHFRTMVIALGLYTSYQTVTNFINFLGLLGGSAAPALADRWLAAVTFGGGGLVVLAIIGHAILRPIRGEGRDDILLVAFLVPAIIALATEAFDPLGGDLRTWGLWRLLAVGLIVHAIARYQLIDIDLKLKTSTRRAVIVGVFVLVFFTVAELVERTIADQWGTASGFLAAAALTLAFRPLDLAADRVADRLFPNVSDDYDYLQARKAEVYEAALERTLEDWDPHETWDDEVLHGLRRSLGITKAQHDAILRRVIARGGEAAERAAPMPVVRPGETLHDRYRVDRLLGQGTYGRAFLAFDAERDEEVVLKVVGTAALGGRAAEMLRREAAVLKELDHPNVVRVHEVLEGPHEVVLVMEYASGGNLRGLLERRTKLGLSDATRILDEVLAGLEATHARGVVHRDVKPENVLLTRDGRAMLADFGIARESGPEATAATAGPAGTLLYMAPEQVRGGEAGPPADLYAAAVVYHEMLTGRYYLPLAGADDFLIRKRILEKAPELQVGDERAWVRDVLQRALAKEPDERFASATEMREALEIRAGPTRRAAAAERSAPG